jgi:amino acid transporter
MAHVDDLVETGLGKNRSARCPDAPSAASRITPIASPTTENHPSKLSTICKFAARSSDQAGKNEYCKVRRNPRFQRVSEFFTGDEAELLSALLASSHRLMPWLLSLLTLGIFWVAQQTQLSQLARSNRDLTWLHLAFLAIITILPFTTPAAG